jgi:hypothetical protein
MQASNPPILRRARTVRSRDADRLFLSDLLETDEPALFASLRSVLQGVPTDIIRGTHDIWCRDFMPFQLDEDTFCQFVYDPDYLLGFGHLVTPPENCRLPFMQDCRRERVRGRCDHPPAFPRSRRGPPTSCAAGEAASALA